ncbi:MAG: cytochrome c biogenesis protein CcdA [Chloroflexota bacterium]|nr:cytochrome c biogenesis protein CcdA [Dehalococcoidia bacterium]MDW8254735.1 cytochrome c biogenesis protein CcdA [Chloroflexota bacterium]
MTDLVPHVSWTVAFLAGLVSFLSPCVAPLVPGYVAYVSGASLDRPAPITRVLGTTLLFVLGFTFVFVALGMSAGLVGAAMEGVRPVLYRAGGALLIVMGLTLIGIGPRFLQADRRVHLPREALGPAGPVLLGMAFAFGWTPCIGPILASILFYAGTRETVGQAGLLLLAYSLGLGLPFVAVGVGLSRLLGAWRALRRVSGPLSALSGLTLIAVGVLFLTDRSYIVAMLVGRLAAFWPVPSMG